MRFSLVNYNFAVQVLFLVYLKHEHSEHKMAQAFKKTLLTHKLER